MSKHFLCPKPGCGQSFSNKRSLSGHVPHCLYTGTAFDQFEVAAASRKRHAKESNHPITIKQKIKEAVDKPNVPIQHMSKMSSMPSINIMASKNTYNSPYFQITTIDIEEIDSYPPVHSQSQSQNTSGDCTNDMVTYSSSLTPSLLYQVHLEYKLRNHREVDLSIQDDINSLLMLHVSHGLDLNLATLIKRKQLIKCLSRTFKLEGLKPTICRLPLSLPGEYASVAVYNVRQSIKSLLTDPTLMQAKHFYDDYDIFSGRPKGCINHYSGIHTGKLFEPARRRYCGSDPNNFPCPLVLFYDKTHVDLHGSLACSPIIGWIGIFKESALKSLNAIRVFGYVPNLGYGKSKNNTQKAHDKLQDEHNCLRQVFNQIKQIHDDGGIVMKVLGRNVKVRVWIHLITGDTSGHNDLCGHYNGSSTTTMPYRSCKCSLQNLDNSKPSCRLVTLEEVSVAADNDTLHFISKHNIESCFKGVPLSDPVHGIMGVTPPEMLHVAGVGIFKYMLTSVSDIIGSKDSHAKQKDQYNELHSRLCALSTIQSEKDFPRTSRRNGVLDGTKMSGKERIGNVAIVLLSSYTAEGKSILSDGMRKHKFTLKEFQECIKLMLSFYQWVHMVNRKSSIRKARKVVVHMLNLLKKCFPRTEGHGWKIPKFHCWANMLSHVERFGSASVFDGGKGERYLKSIVKDLVKTTQKVPSKLVEQIAKRKYENHVIEHAYTFGVVPAMNLREESEEKVDKIEFKGEYHMQFGVCDHHGRGSVTIDWKSEERNRLKIDIHPLMKEVIRNYSLKFGWTGSFDVKGYTSYTTQMENNDNFIKFHANEVYHGKQWYDWCMVNFKVSDSSEEWKTCPSKIIGFFSYMTAGIPTPINQSQVEDDTSRVMDPTQYAVIHTAKEYVSWDFFEKNFVITFELGGVESLYMVDVQTIESPLFVIPDSNKFISILPTNRWHNYFNNHL